MAETMALLPSTNTYNGLGSTDSSPLFSSKFAKEDVIVKSNLNPHAKDYAPKTTIWASWTSPISWRPSSFSLPSPFSLYSHCWLQIWVSSSTLTCQIHTNAITCLPACHQLTSDVHSMILGFIFSLFSGIAIRNDHCQASCFTDK